MDMWFEIVLTVYGLMYLFIQFMKLGMMIDDEPPEITDEMRRRIYS
jgi:hypothetical protein